MAGRLTVNKDIARRKKFKNKENHYRIFQILINDCYAPIEDRYISSYDHLYSVSKISKRTSIKNKCIISGRNRSVSSFFKLTRMVFKNLAVKGDLSGVRKHSW